MVEPTNNEANEKAAGKPPPSRVQRIWRWFLIGSKTLLTFLVGYFLIVLIGLIPVNNDFVPSKITDAGSVRIFVQSSDVHADILLPLVSEQINWLDYLPLKKNPRPKDYLSIGWGERAFYLETPTWGHLTVRKAVSAMLLPSESVMHCELARPRESDTCKSVVISAKQYDALVRYVKSSFQSAPPPPLANGNVRQMLRPIEIDRQQIHTEWSTRHHFYKANGAYHALNTCNCWVGNGLEYAGVRTAWFTPMPKTVFMYLPDSDE